MSKLCPSAQPGMDNCRVLGIVDQEGPKPKIVYLNEILPATNDVLALSAPLKPTEVFRLSATCSRQSWTICLLAPSAESAVGSRRKAEPPANVAPK